MSRTQLVKGTVAGWLALCAFALSGCSTIEPQAYWTGQNKEPGKNECPAEDIDKDRACPRLTPEVWKLRIDDRFKLHFVEFDDQGWLYADAKQQIDWVMDDLRKILADTDKQLRLVVYVHGWKHNAEPDDADVRKFRH